MFATGDGLLRHTDELTDDGLKQIFATNIFGHFILVSLSVCFLQMSSNTSYSMYHALCL